MWEFKEDILQLEYEEKRTLDLGWYPEFNPEGKYKLQLIDSKNKEQPDWENPIYFFESHEETIEDFIEKHHFAVMPEVIETKKTNNVISYYPHIRSKTQLENVLQNEDWGFSCVALSPTSQHLFIIRGIEEEGNTGVKIKEIQNGFYDKLI